MNKDMRFNIELINGLVGKKFEKYRHDQFDFTNSVTQRVGLFIGGKIYNLINEQQSVNYFGNSEDVSVFDIEESTLDMVRSAFEDIQQIDTPVEGIITEIRLINENQKVSSQEDNYEVWLTRAIVFVVDGREITFEKDNVPFSEEITIIKGYSTEERLSDESDFLEGWDETKVPECYREKVILK